MALGGFEAKSDGRYGWPDGVPIDYQAQAQWAMFVTGLRRWYFGVLHGNLRFAAYELEANETDQQTIFKAARSFWFDRVLAGVPPEVDDSDATAAAIARVWPDSIPGASVELDDMAAEIEQLRLARRCKAIAEKAERYFANRLAVAVADAEEGTVDGRRALTYRKQERAGYFVEPTDFRVMRLTPLPKDTAP
jgi:predicted phage-related endonuclease